MSNVTLVNLGPLVVKQRNKTHFYPIKNVHQLKSIDGVKYQSIQPLQNVRQLGLFKAAG